MLGGFQHAGGPRGVEGQHHIRRRRVVGRRHVVLLCRRAFKVEFPLCAAKDEDGQPRQSRSKRMGAFDLHSIADDKPAVRLVHHAHMLFDRKAGVQRHPINPGLGAGEIDRDAGG